MRKEEIKCDQVEWTNKFFSRVLRCEWDIQIVIAKPMKNSKTG